MTNSFIPTAGHVVFQDNIGRNGDYDPGNVKALIAPEIDWCGAKLPNGGNELGESIKIYTSDELLELLNGMQHKLQVLRQAIIDIGNRSENNEEYYDEG